MPLSIDALDEELCEYCTILEEHRGVHCYGGEPVMCVDSGECEVAYARYLEEFIDAINNS